MVTPHLNSNISDISDVVIISGDPLRAKYISKNFLKNSIQINNVRSMFGYTGYYKKKRISIMSHGMGIPSLSIYVNELVSEYNVKKIIRLGTCGGINKKVKIKDIVFAMGASTDSSINRLRFGGYDFSSISDFKMLYQAYIISKNYNFNVHIGNIFTTDSFYGKDSIFFNLIKKFNILAIDMETSGLYSLSSELKFKSLSICTVSDEIFSKKKITSLEREKTLNNSILISLDLALLN
ncbi:MAG: purine-nucleoside phosphorylase [Buchnera aphidicola (Periphyllus lyropictus)]|uniref:purine-nucleoside phosphorylase n=1 Tax=Buchnera aphidicola TaxID=9 RepID=UPI001EB13C3F|nr:purine-nucleoside phosphorylase [Buchnera aphidicola]NIH16459.1 purine-nucleoside phosphorylase [Buchnera aphidicola (Periphyllus lyropictus)]USS94744.1 purine-nucleoside phosphorylase [Buchnera aphidicola (Periphyllus lyropictus)]